MCIHSYRFFWRQRVSRVDKGGMAHRSFSDCNGSFHPNYRRTSPLLRRKEDFDLTWSNILSFVLSWAECCEQIHGVCQKSHRPRVPGVLRPGRRRRPGGGDSSGLRGERGGETVGLLSFRLLRYRQSLGDVAYVDCMVLTRRRCRRVCGH